MVKEMLNVLMDGIKDTNMLLDYGSEAETSEQRSWFMVHAKHRIEQLTNDYAFICQQIGLDQKVKDGDVIAEALKSHLEQEVSNLKNRFSVLSS